MRAALAALVLLLGGLACKRLPDVQPDVCGNGVIETGEDCDGFAFAEDTRCRDPGEPGECRFDCGSDGQSESYACPAGWGCDAEHICRPPTGEFETPTAPLQVGAWSLRAGDLDGDGRAEIVARDALDGLGRASTRVLFLGEDLILEADRPFPRPVILADVRDFSGDGRADLLFSDARLGALLGRADGLLVPETFSSFRLDDPRVLAVFDESVGGLTGFLILTTINDVPGFYAPRADSLDWVGALPGTLDDLVANPVRGNIFSDHETSPCDELIYAERGATEFWVADPCGLNPDSREVVWRPELSTVRVRLRPKAAIDAAPQIVDLNGDGHLDVLLRASGVSYGALGDGTSLADATPYRVRGLGEDGEFEIPLTFPLAAADFSADGFVDFVFPDHLLVSGTGSGDLPFYHTPHTNYGAPWDNALVADFDGNGRLDVVAASQQAGGIAFFRGSTNENQPELALSTVGPVDAVREGDFDGDGVTDLAILERTQTSDVDRVLTIAFGNAWSSPEPAVEVARFRNVTQLAAFREAGFSHLAVASREAAADPKDSVITMLSGSADRSLLALMELTTFAQDGDVATYLALNAAAGEFVVEGQHDVIAFSSRLDGSAPALFWLPGFVEKTRIPERLPIDLPLELDPGLAPEEGQVAYSLHIAGSAADLDGDGRDEAVFASLAKGGEECSLLILKGYKGEIQQEQSLRLSRPCREPQLLITDVDGDDAPDLVVLGRDPERGGTLSCWWNDGSGSFDAEIRTVINGPESDPAAFTFVDTGADGTAGFVYVDETGVWFVPRAGWLRKFDPPGRLAEIPNATGVASADFNGDGVADLAVAASGQLRIMQARLRSR